MKYIKEYQNVMSKEPARREYPPLFVQNHRALDHIIEEENSCFQKMAQSNMAYFFVISLGERLIHKLVGYRRKETRAEKLSLLFTDLFQRAAQALWTIPIREGSCVASRRYGSLNEWSEFPNLFGEFDTWDW